MNHKGKVELLDAHLNFKQHNNYTPKNQSEVINKVVKNKMETYSDALNKCLKLKEEKGHMPHNQMEEVQKVALEEVKEEK